MPNKPLADAEEELSFAAVQEQLARLRDTQRRLSEVGDIGEKEERIAAIDRELSQGWDKVANASQLQQERSQLLAVSATLGSIGAQFADLAQMLELAREEQDFAVLADLASQAGQLDAQLEQQQLLRLLATPHAEADSYLDIQFGSGGTESQDWARMLKRMYLGYAGIQNWKTSVIDETPGEAGIKSATLLVRGTHAYGILRTETGVHRLVRKSPFDANHRRHTSFASVFAYPVLPASEEVKINSGDLRIDTYRASGAGGQHVNTTDSAVRITHLPSDIVVQSQNDRSQHKNRATAMSMLKSRLQLQRQAKEDEVKKKIEEGKADITWGAQIRSYVLDQSRIKDLRTGEECGDVQSVLDGSKLDRFIKASLHAGL